MMYWKHIDLPGWEHEVQKLKSWVLASPVLRSRQFWNVIDPQVMAYKTTNLGELLKTHLDSECVYCAVIVSHNASENVHIDYMDGVKARLQLPIMNVEGSLTKFFSAPASAKKLVRVPNNAPYWAITPGAETFETEVCIDRPTIIRTDQAHSVKANAARLPRITLTVRLDKDPVRFLT